MTTVLFPWNQKNLPGAKTIVDNMFHFHPEILNDFKRSRKEEGIIKKDKCIYHLPKPNADEDEVDDEDEHDQCLNRIFGFGYSYEKGQNPTEVDEFYSWLQSIMVPTITVYAGSDKMNPVGVFFVTKISPGWVGGALTSVIYT